MNPPANGWYSLPPPYKSCQAVPWYERADGLSIWSCTVGDPAQRPPPVIYQANGIPSSRLCIRIGGTHATIHATKSTDSEAEPPSEVHPEK